MTETISTKPAERFAMEIARNLPEAGLALLAQQENIILVRYVPTNGGKPTGFRITVEQI